MPRLILESRRIAATVIHGLHGRRRAGSGENFWQFRRYVSGEEARRIDWRRSARGDELYVREKEWEAAHTVWIWPDRSPSMKFSSRTALKSKLERTLGDLASRLPKCWSMLANGSAFPGLMRPTGSRAVIDRMADAITHDPNERASLPQGFAPAPLAEIVVISDLWSPVEEIRTTLSQLSANGAHGHLVQIVDPAEETFPYSGHVEFIEPEGARLSPSAAPRTGAPLRSAARAPPRRIRAASTSLAGASSSTAPTGSRTNCCWRFTSASVKAMPPCSGARHRRTSQEKRMRRSA